MPAREEIVEWLTRESEDIYQEWVDLLGHNRSEKKAYKWMQQANQVASMRCETCRHYERKFIGDCGEFHEKVELDFGCFAHEPKEKPAD